MISQARHEDYFESVYHETFRQLSQYVFFKTPNVRDAEDLVATVYTDFYRYVARKGKRPDHILAYLIRMANHELSRLYADRPPLVSLDDDALQLTEHLAEDQDSAQGLFDQIDLDALWQLLERLKESERQVIIAHFRFDLTFREIAQALGQTESAVKLRFYRALGKLKKMCL